VPETALVDPSVGTAIRIRETTAESANRVPLPTSLGDLSGTISSSRNVTRASSKKVASNSLLKEGTALMIAPDTQVTADIREAIEAWITEDPPRGQATWVNGNPRCLVWAVDGEQYSTSGLAERIVSEASGHSASITGPTWWADETGLRLHELLEEHTEEPVYTSQGGERDWSSLHVLLDKVPAGKWTSYKDLADAIGSSPIAVGQHVTRCNECELGYRVLNLRGTIAPGFTWSDENRDDDPRELLESEGVRFDSAGRADPDQRHRFG